VRIACSIWVLLGMKRLRQKIVPVSARYH
jgi:hypothetical protein